MLPGASLPSHEAMPRALMICSTGPFRSDTFSTKSAGAAVMVVR